MSTPALGMITVPHWEWWLHNHPFRGWQPSGRWSCPICSSDTGCCAGCPQKAIEQKFEEVVALMREWNGRHDAQPAPAVKPTCRPRGENWLHGHFWNQDGSGCECGKLYVKDGIVYFGAGK